MSKSPKSVSWLDAATNMRHPRCIQHWRRLIQVLEDLAQGSKLVNVTWSQGPNDDGLVVTISFSGRPPGERRSFFEVFDSEIRRGTPELEQAKDGTRDRT